MQKYRGDGLRWKQNTKRSENVRCGIRSKWPAWLELVFVANRDLNRINTTFFNGSTANRIACLSKEGIIHFGLAALKIGRRLTHLIQRLQTICNKLGSEQVQAFFDKWVTRLPWRLTAEDRKAGYHHRLSIWQMEISRTQVLTRPVHGREFFEQVIREKLDLVDRIGCS